MELGKSELESTLGRLGRGDLGSGVTLLGWLLSGSGFALHAPAVRSVPFLKEEILGGVNSITQEEEGKGKERRKEDEKMKRVSNRYSTRRLQ